MIDNEQNIEQNETGQTNPKPPTQTTVPEQYRGLPSEVAEELMKGGDPIDETAKQAWDKRKEEILDELRRGENEREVQKAANFAERYQKLAPEEHRQFPEHQSQSQAMITEAIQGKADLPDLSVEEQLVVNKLKDAYEKHKQEHPNEPFQFQLSRDIDQRVFDNLSYRLVFEAKTTAGQTKDQEEIEQIRENLELPQQPPETENQEGSPELPVDIARYLRFFAMGYGTYGARAFQNNPEHGQLFYDFTTAINAIDNDTSQGNLRNAANAYLALKQWVYDNGGKEGFESNANYPKIEEMLNSPS